jgi:hypothetical protein
MSDALTDGTRYRVYDAGFKCRVIGTGAGSQIMDGGQMMQNS